MNIDNNTYAEKRTSFRVFPPLNAVNEIAIWFKGFDADEQVTLADLGMPDMVSVNTEKRIIIEDLSGAGMRISLDKKAIALRGINRISERITVYLKLDTALRGKGDLSSMLIGIQVIGASHKEHRIELRAKILVQARLGTLSNKLNFYNVEKAGVKDIHVIREEITRMPKKITKTGSLRKVEMENLLIELMADDDTQGIPEKE